MNNKEITKSIEVSDKLDDYVLKGIERGRNEKKLVKTNNGYIKTTTKIAGVFVVGTIALGAINPDIIRAIPIIGKAIESFDPSNFGEPTDKYVKYAKGMEMVSKNKKAKVTLTDIMVDENELMVGLIVESEVLRGFEGVNESDFINIDSDIELNGKSVDNQAYKASKINDTTAGVIIRSNIADMKLDDKVEVDLNIRGINGTSYIEGKWNFKVEIEKVDGSNRIYTNESYTIKGQKLIVKEIVTSPLSSTIILAGTDDIENYTLQGTKFNVVDDKGNLLKSNELGSSVDTKTGEFHGKISIDSDLSNTKYIELIPYWGDGLTQKVIEDMYLPLLTTTGSGAREQVVVSRKPTEEELKNGYAASQVHYYLNLDNNREFLSLDELKGYEIPVSNTDKVIIKDIQVDEKGTKITMKKEGEYKYLSELVIFDEDMNDFARWEGHIGAVLENEEEQIYSITLGKIDTSKKYKIGLPMTKDIDFNSEEKIRINL